MINIATLTLSRVGCSEACVRHTPAQPKTVQTRINCRRPYPIKTVKAHAKF